MPTIEWMRAAYPKDARLYVNNMCPPLDEQQETYDLVYASSVFSHLSSWAPWVLEVRRVLKIGGVFVASLHGRGFWSLGFFAQRGIDWDEDRTGLLVEGFGEGFDDSFGPAVYVSEWWVRNHWGRALDIERFEPTGFAIPWDRTTGQAWIVARKRALDREPTVDDLVSPSHDRREIEAALRGQWLAYEEIEHRYRAELRGLRALAGSAQTVSEELETARRRITGLEEELRRAQSS
jgi:SAM-dependent methyltransferase